MGLPPDRQPLAGPLAHRRPGGAGRPGRKGEAARAEAHLFKPLRQLIESVNQTFKGQLTWNTTAGGHRTGVAVRLLRRILALTPRFWHNHHTD